MHTIMNSFQNSSFWFVQVTGCLFVGRAWEKIRTRLSSSASAFRKRKRFPSSSHWTSPWASTPPKISCRKCPRLANQVCTPFTSPFSSSILKNTAIKKDCHEFSTSFCRDICGRGGKKNNPSNQVMWYNKKSETSTSLTNKNNNWV